MERDQEKTIIMIGDGWAIYTTPGCAWIKFSHKPDDKTLVRLRTIAAWDHLEKAWRAHPDDLDRLSAIGDQSMTWERVGEDAPSWLSDDDYPIFH